MRTNNTNATLMSRAEEQDRALKAYVNGGYSRIAGWLEPLALRSILLLDQIQKERAVKGSMCEIGVHKARLLILLHLLSRPDERTVGFDLFELMESDVSAAYGNFNRDSLIKSLAEQGCNLEQIELVAADSARLTVENVLSRTLQPVRLFSVDGGHDAETALGDLCLASRVVAPAGIILLDDIFNEQWCGVAEAAARFMLRTDHNLVPFLHCGNKMFFAAGRDSADIYRARISANLTDISTKIEKFFGQPVLIAWLPPMSAAARAASLIIGQRGLQKLRKNRLISALRRSSARAR